MAALKDKLRSDLTDAMRARDELRTGTLRMALTAVTTEEVAGTQARELDDDEVLKILAREAKKRREASEAFTAAGRPELAEREEAELGVLGDLPAGTARRRRAQPRSSTRPWRTSGPPARTGRARSARS